MTALTADDRRTIRSALNRAIDDRMGLADSYVRGAPEREAALALVAKYEALHVKLFRSPSQHALDAEADKAAPMVSIFDLVKRGDTK